MVDEPDRIWQEEANHPETSAERLIELSADSQLRSVVASNPSAPASLLEQLAEDQAPQVRQGVAGNPNTPWPTLEQLAWEFPRAFLHNPAGPLQMVARPEQISTKDTFWGALLREASLPSPWWGWLKSHPALSASQAVHLHVQYAGEATHLYDVPHDEEEGVLLTLVELLTAAGEQGIYGHILGDNTVSSQSLCQNVIKEYLQRLAYGLDPEVRQAVAAHPHTPMEILHRLSQDENPMVRKVVAEQKRLPGGILRMLAQDKDPMVRLVVAKQGQTPGEVLYALAQDENGEVRLAVVKHSHIPVEVLYILAQDKDAWNRRWAAAHSQIPVDALCALAQDEDASVRCAVAEHPHTPVAVFHQLCLDPDEWVRCSVAGNPQTPVEILRTLAQDKHVRTRSGIASHPHTPVEILRLLAQDEDASVRCAVAENPHTPMEVLHLLSLDQDKSVRSAIVFHPQTSEEILLALGHDKEMGVRRAVARNPQTPREVLRQLCLDPHEWVRHAVASHPQTPEEVLRTLARNVPQNRDVHHNLGLAVAMHPQGSAETLRLLTQYPNKQVQWLARFVQKLVAECGDVGRKQAWWAKLRWFFVDVPNRGWIGIMSIETQLEEIAALDIPEHLRQMVITALAADWDSKHTFAVTDKRDATTILRARLTFYKHLLAPFLPPIALQKLAVSPHWEVRYLVALHARTPWETRQRLSQDGNRYVRAVAQANLDLVSGPAPDE